MARLTASAVGHTLYPVCDFTVGVARSDGFGAVASASATAAGAATAFAATFAATSATISAATTTATATATAAAFAFAASLGRVWCSDEGDQGLLPEGVKQGAAELLVARVGSTKSHWDLGEVFDLLRAKRRECCGATRCHLVEGILGLQVAQHPADEDEQIFFGGSAVWRLGNEVKSDIFADV